MIPILNQILLADLVYLSHPAGREEFVMTDVGKVYGGSHNNIQGRPWVFGQFRDSVLPAACHLLDHISQLKASERGDPIKVCRAISAVVNSNDDKGLLQGRWDGFYSDGTPPFEWTGSVPILEVWIFKCGFYSTRSLKFLKIVELQKWQEFLKCTYFALVCLFCLFV